MATEPRPVLLQPTVYDPSAGDAFSGVQRNIEQEEAHRRLAEDSAARVRALQRAKEAVLSRLGREFCGRRGRAEDAAPPPPPPPCRLVAGHEPLLDDRGSMGSRSTLVPLFFSRN
ncbi:hypothetical protein CDD83_755 [Cordyceps sp. RAO-2017]|nr:hypothetical protein CDD83_755 [Cordyceps sp. RAO-2017]